VWASHPCSAFLLLGDVVCIQVPLVLHIIGKELPQTFNIVTPVAVQFTGYSEPIHQLYAGSCHSCLRRVTSHPIKGT
jgi:hypothetical protein